MRVAATLAERSYTRKRIWLKHGRATRRFVLMDGPVPRKNDVCTIDGADWLVTKVEDTEVLAEFSTAGGKLKQVWP